MPASTAIIRHRDKNKNVIWEGKIHNIFHDEGEEYLVKTAFTEALAVPANHYMGLDNRTALAEGDVLTDVTAAEPGTASGYARQAVATNATDYTASQVGGNWQVVTSTETFSASGGSIGPVANVFLCDQSTGKTGDLYLSLALSTSRTLADGESLDCTVTIAISE